MEIDRVPQILRHRLATPLTSFGPLTRMPAILDNNLWIRIWVLGDGVNCIIGFNFSLQRTGGKKTNKQKKLYSWPPTITELHEYLQIVLFSKCLPGLLHMEDTTHFHLSHLLIMGERHTSCDLTQGCIDSPAPPSSITQNKWRSISSDMYTENETERERLEEENKTEQN